MKYFGRIFSYVRPYRGLGVMTLVIILIGGVFGLLAPWPLKFLVDNVLGGQPLPGWLSRWLGSAAENKVALLVAVSVASVVSVDESCTFTAERVPTLWEAVRSRFIEGDTDVRFPSIIAVT